MPKRMEAALNYNEKKVQQGSADCLYAANYLKDAGQMNFYQKQERFTRLNNLNQRATTKTLHVSLNFSPAEKLSDEGLIAIASDYMKGIGFGDQPYLVYKHRDAGHPHIHIVSNTIRPDGSRINTHNLGRNQSEQTRKAIEIRYRLVKAEQQGSLRMPGIKPVAIGAALYGKVETKRAIAGIVSQVVDQYRYCSLPELNAVLKQFNVLADRGAEEGRIYKNRGLLYRLLDADGNKKGVPIKASVIGCKPTLANLEQKFIVNKAAKEPFKQRVQNAIDDCLPAAKEGLHQLVAALSQKNIYTVLRQNAEGRLYGITFVDNQSKCVFNGSELGRGYSAAALQSRLAATAEKVIMAETPDAHSSGAMQKALSLPKLPEKTMGPVMKNDKLLDILLSVKESYENPFSLLKKRKKKKKKKTTNQN